MVIVAPGTVAAVGSVTVPMIVPDPYCAFAEKLRIFRKIRHPVSWKK
jgi:hypothetical protein